EYGNRRIKAQGPMVFARRTSCNRHAAGYHCYAADADHFQPSTCHTIP
ncbi:hypothetical protein PENNAL_c0762G06619, partial [Penicillium nalgiovense]